MIRIIFAEDGPIDLTFVEVENEAGKSISVGEWVNDGDGLWALEIKELPNEDNV